MANTHRIYQTFSGQINELFQEWEFEDFEARDKFWADVPHNPEFMEKWAALADSGGSREFLTLIE